MFGIVSNRFAGIWLLLLLLAALVASRAAAEPASPPDAALGAGLWVAEGEADEPWLAPQVSTEVHVHVSGMLARTRIEQLFENPSEQAVEAVYVFPLPENAAVSTISLQVGNRTLTGALRERAAATRAFEAGAQRGSVAGIVSQVHAGLFTTRVANIPAGARVAVTLGYEQLIPFQEGMLSLEVPATLTPRAALDEPALAPEAASARQRASRRLDPPFALDGSGPLLDVAVELDAGVDLRSIESPSHELTLARRADHVQVRLSEGPWLADRDFTLRWRPADSGPAVSIEDVGSARFVLAAVRPPPEPQTALPGTATLALQRARDITFVVDTSLSMAGAPLNTAVAALRSALGRLSPSDHFNVIEAGPAPRALFEASRPASASELAGASEHAGRSKPAGEVALAPALLAALRAPSHPDRSERVVLISGGAIDDARPLIRQIESSLGARRLFTVGVGAAPDRHVLRQLARSGRGTFTAIASPTEVSARMAALDAALGPPLLESIALAAPARGRVRLSGELYAGEMLGVLARLDDGAASVMALRGRRAGEPWQRELALADATRQRGLFRLWAQRELDALAWDAEGSPDAELLELARQGGLLSPLTSLIVVDRERSVEERAPSSAVPLALPAGSEMFGKPSPAPEGPTCSSGWPTAGRGRSALAARAHVQCGQAG